MPDVQVDPTPTANVSATPPQMAPETSNIGTVEPVSGDVGQNGQGTPTTEDAFTKIDPNTLPPQLKEAYSNMLSDYKRKTAEIAAQRREFEGVSKKAQIYDQLAGDQKFVDYWNALSKSQQADLKAQAENKEINISDEEWINAVGFVPENKDRFSELISKMFEAQAAPLKSQLEAQQKQLSITHASEVIDEFVAKHPEFDNLEKYGIISLQMQAYGEIPRDQYGRKLTEAYDRGLKAYNEIYALGKNEALGLIKQKQNNSTLAPSNSDSNIYSGKDPKKLSAIEAVALAKQGKRVPDTW